MYLNDFNTIQYKIKHLVLFTFFIIPGCLLYRELTFEYFVYNTDLFNYQNFFDHEVYWNTLNKIKSEGLNVTSLNNDLGISLLYILFIKLFSIFGITNISDISFCVNIITLFLVYKLYTDICNIINLKGKTWLFFFLEFQLLYFVQLINKDLFTILFFLIVLKLLLIKKYKEIIFWSVLFFFVRIQLLVFGLLVLFLSYGNFKKRVIISYVITSLIGGYTAVNGNLISKESMGSGFGSFVMTINSEYYYLGNLLLNPFRILQFFLDIFLSFNIYTDGKIDVAKILRIPILIVLAFHLKYLMYFFKRGFTLNNQLMAITVVIISFFLTWLMNPTVNARYIMLIVPILIILLRYRKLQIS